MNTIKLAIVGSRGFNDYDLLEKTINENYKIDQIEAIVSGGARGADSLGEKYAEKNNINKEIHLPDWKKYGRGAGFVRNKDIVDACDSIILFWDGSSKGTMHSMRLAQKAGKKIHLIEYK